MNKDYPKLTDLWSKFVLQLNKREPFFACVALFSEFRLDESIEAGLTDGRSVRVNPAFLMEKNEQQRFAYLLHQVLHLALQHTQRGVGRRHDIWNIAADIVVNAIIETTTPWKAAPQTAWDHRYATKSVEQVYALLLKQDEDAEPGAGTSRSNASARNDSRSQGGSDDDGNGPGEGAGPDCDDDVSSQPQASNEQQNDGQGERYREGQTDGQSSSALQRLYRSAYDLPHSAQGNSREQASANAYWSRALIQARKLSLQREAGRLPASLSREFQKIDAAQIDWRRSLWRYVSNRCSDFTEFDARHIHRGLYLEQLQNEGLTLAVAIDTSGSIQEKELSVFMNELKGIVGIMPDVTIHLYYCDAEAIGPFTLTSKWVKVATPQGGGGTSFVPFFRKLKALPAVETPDAIVYFTDGYGDFPSKAPKTPTLWVLLEEGIDVSSLPFGQGVTVQRRASEY